MASTINASSAYGIVSTADTSGTLALQANGTTIATVSPTSGFSYSGGIIQVVQGVLSSQFTLTTAYSSFTTIFSATITPKLATSKILVTVSIPIYVSGSVQSTILRNSTDISQNSLSRGFFQQNASGWVGSNAYTYLDSPATTSATTYYYQVKNTGAGTCYVGQDGTPICGTLTLMEVAA
jgi:hypothetical protein